jgi:4-hydroxymandelate oxidase
MAYQVGAHPDGEMAMGRAVAATGSLLGVSTNAAVQFAAIAGTGAPWWFHGGAAGVVVSTHGGRRGAAISTARALPEIVAAIGSQAEVYADSGVRTAQHVAAAIAMSARAVFVGRPVLWALAAAGQEGAEQVIKDLTDDLARVMIQIGAGSIAELTPT